VKVKRLILVNGDEYEDVELFNKIPPEVDSVAPGQFIGVNASNYTVFLQREMIISLQVAQTFKVISS